MEEKTGYVLVDIDVLPEVFEKVLLAKRLIAENKAKNVAESCKQASLSRGAFYKYKDKVFLYEGNAESTIKTFSFKLSDEMGVLSSLLTALYKHGANILTVNQNIPSDRVANVTVSVRIDEVRISLEKLTRKLAGLGGVLEIKTV